MNRYVAYVVGHKAATEGVYEAETSFDARKQCAEQHKVGTVQVVAIRTEHVNLKNEE